VIALSRAQDDDLVAVSNLASILEDLVRVDHEILAGLVVVVLLEQEGFGAPGQSQPVVGVLVAGQAVDRGGRTLTGDAVHGGAGLGVSNDGLGVELVGQVHSGGGDSAGGGHVKVLELRDAVEAVVGGVAGDTGHGGHGHIRVLTNGGLVGGHGGVGAVEDGVGAVGSLCTSRNRGVHHGAEDFGSHDDRLGVLASQLDDALSGQRDLFQRALNGHVATGGHDAVEGLDDLFEVLQSLRLLDLGNDRDATAFLVHDLVGAVDVGGETHEGHGDDVGTGADGPTQVGLILLGQSRQGDGDARQVDALVGGHRTGHDDLGVHVVALDLGDLKTDLAVIDQDRVARVAIARQALEGGGGDVLVALDVISGDDEFLAELQLNLVFAIGVLLEPTAANLRALQINERGNVATSGFAGLAHVVVDLEVILGGAVGAVQTSNVHTSFNELQEVVVILGGRTNGVYDLGFTHECLPILVQFGSRRDCPICRNPVY
jgi:hypothetical protein